MAAERTYPVQILGKQMAALNEALTGCRADPGAREVHRLRTTTRRLEAQLQLVEALPGLPKHGKRADRFRLLLRCLRRTAGGVRDLDVHLNRLADLQAEISPQIASGSQVLAEGTEELVAHLQRGRDREAARLRELLDRRHAGVVKAGKRLMRRLSAAAETALPVADLIQQAQALPNGEGLLTREHGAGLSEAGLHSVRKAAKAARYMTETAPKSASARDAALHLQALQDVGGQWHDTLELVRVARHYLGKSHALTVSLVAERDRSLEAYHQVLAAERLHSPRKPQAEHQAHKARAVA